MKVSLMVSCWVFRYCAKLPSDTFTHLVPDWSIAEVTSRDGTEVKYTCTLQLPINSPVKKPITVRGRVQNNEKHCSSRKST